MASDDEEHHEPTHMIGNSAQYTLHIPQRRHYPKQLCQKSHLIPDTPEYPAPEDQGQRNIFRPYDLSSSSATTSDNSFPNVSAVADGLQNLRQHTHPEHKNWAAGCLVCRKLFEQIIEAAVAVYLHQTVQPSESV